MNSAMSDPQVSLLESFLWQRVETNAEGCGTPEAWTLNPAALV